MKSTTLLIFGIICSMGVFMNPKSIGAQESKGIKGGGGFGGPLTSLSFPNSEPMISFGGGGAFVLQNGLFFGGFGMGSSGILKVDSDREDFYLQMGYGGLWAGYTHPLSGEFKIVPSVKFGAGEVELVNDDLQQKFFDSVLVLSPEVAVSKRLNAYSSLEIGVFYQWFSGLELNGISDSQLSNIGVSINMKFGGGLF